MQKGLAPIFVIFLIALIIAGLIVFKNKTANQPVVQNTQEASSSASPKQEATSSKESKISPSPIGSKAPTPTPKPSLSASPVTAINTSTGSAPSNPYDLNSPTGSVKVMVTAQSGELGYTPQAELSSVSGFKVLDGKSTDKITQSGPNRNDYLRGEILFSTAPPGPYKVRISYNGSWSDQKDVTVSSAKQSTVEFSVAGVTPAPTPTPKPKPVCGVLVASLNGTEPAIAPYEAHVCVGNNSNPYQSVQQEFVDYNGDGSWDYQGVSYGCHNYTFQKPGTYSPKAKIISTSGDESDTCQTSVTVN